MFIPLVPPKTTGMLRRKIYIGIDKKKIVETDWGLSNNYKGSNNSHIPGGLMLLISVL